MYSPEFVKKFKVNRPLDDDERCQQQHLHDRLRDYNHEQPNYELAVIQFNSTFVEITDRNYPAKGVATLCAFFGLYISLFPTLSSLCSMVFEKKDHLDLFSIFFPFLS